MGREIQDRRLIYHRGSGYGSGWLETHYMKVKCELTRWTISNHVVLDREAPPQNQRSLLHQWILLSRFLVFVLSKARLREQSVVDVDASVVGVGLALLATASIILLTLNALHDSIKGVFCRMEAAKLSCLHKRHGRAPHVLALPSTMGSRALLHPGFCIITSEVVLFLCQSIYLSIIRW